MKKNIGLVISLFAVSVLDTALAQTPPTGGGGGGGNTLPSTLPVTSQEALIANAKRLVIKVNVSVYSRGFVYGARGVNTMLEREYVPSIPNQPDFSEVAALVSTGNFVFETRNPRDPITVRMWLSDRNHREIFSGSSEFRLVEGRSGNFAPPSPTIPVRLYPSGEIPLEIQNADWAEIALLNARGETVQVRGLERDQSGMFLFPLWLAGQRNAQLTAFDSRADGTTVKAVYSLLTGAQQTTHTRSVGASGVFDRVYLPDAGNTVIINMADERAAEILRQGVSPLVQIRFEKQQTLFFYAELPQEVARGFWLRRADQSGWVFFPIVKGKWSEVTLEAGVYDIVIDWPTFGRYQQTFTEPSSGGEKGGGLG